MTEEETGCPYCGCKDNYFDRTVCACDVMHTRCTECGRALDYCPLEGRL